VPRRPALDTPFAITRLRRRHHLPRSNASEARPMCQVSLRSSRSYVRSLSGVRNGGAEADGGGRGEGMSDGRRTLQGKRLHVGLAILVVGYVFVYAASSVWTFSYTRPDFHIGIGLGALYAARFEGDLYHKTVSTSGAAAQWQFYRAYHAPHFAPRPYFSARHHEGVETSIFCLPLWIPLLPLLFLAAVVTYREPTPPRPRRVPQVSLRSPRDHVGPVPLNAARPT
jgi:hypothetical protein